MSEYDLDTLAEELSDFAPAPAKEGRTAREERILAGFEDIQRFVDTHGRVPRHGEGLDIFERLYAVRLDRIRALPEAASLLGPLDHQGLLSADHREPEAAESLSDEELLAELDGVVADADVRTLRHVRSPEERRAAEEIANRTRCEDFDTFAPLFKHVESDLAAGLRGTQPVKNSEPVAVGDFFVLGGQFVYVAEKGAETTAANGQPDARLRVIYSNATESNLLLRSLVRALERDDAGRRVVDLTAPTLFSQDWADDDVSSGTIYVLRSLSSHPFIVEHRELIHKIGVTGGTVEERIANASHEATYLLADVQLVATYKLASVNRRKVEALFHRVFAKARLDLNLEDRFGTSVRPQEWFLVPLDVIDEVVKRIASGSIVGLVYEPAVASLVPIEVASQKS